MSDPEYSEEEQRMIEAALDEFDERNAEVNSYPAPKRIAMKTRSFLLTMLFLALGIWAATLLLSYLTFDRENPPIHRNVILGGTLGIVLLIAGQILIALFLTKESKKFNIIRAALLFVGMFAVFTIICFLMEGLFDFGVFTTLDNSIKTQIGWLTKGAFFDIVESFDLQMGEYEAENFPIVFNGLEASIRLLWGIWSAYTLISLFKILESMTVTDLEADEPTK